jgi:hypothetical protein
MQGYRRDGVGLAREASGIAAGVRGETGRSKSINIIQSMKFKRCATCSAEIHTTLDGIEIDHEPDCTGNPLTKQIEIYHDAATDQFIVKRADDPQNPYHPITQNGMIDLLRNLRRYEQDYWNEKHRL